MNILYLVGPLLLLVILGYPYLMLVLATKQQGATRRMGQGIAILFVIVLLLLIILYATGIARMPAFSFMGERASPRMIRDMSGYVTGTMLEDDRAIDEFTSGLKTNPQLLDKFKEKLGQ